MPVPSGKSKKWPTSKRAWHGWQICENWIIVLEEIYYAMSLNHLLLRLISTLLKLEIFNPSKA